MRRIKVRVCTGKRCCKCDSELLLDVKASLTDTQREAVKFKDAECLGHCGKKKHGEPPFVEVDGTVLPNATPKGLQKLVLAALEKRDE